MPEPAEPRGRRRLDVERRRAEILEAAELAFADGAYGEVSAGEIAAASGSSTALVFHYFGTKAGLYGAVVEAAVERLRAAHDAAQAALPDGSTARDRVAASIAVYLDHIATHPAAWAAPLRAGGEPAPAQEIRAAARAEYVARLAGLLGVGEWPRHAYAVEGYFGFLDAACLRWAERGCPTDERHALADAALGALEGALGDWRV